MNHPRGPRLRLVWEQYLEGWRTVEVSVRDGEHWISCPKPSGLHLVLHIDRPPAANFVELDKEGMAYPFYPAKTEELPDGRIVFHQQLLIGRVRAEW